jgi:ribosomal protein L32E
MIMVVRKKKHPKFFRQNYGRTDRKRIGEGWKRPRGHEPNIGWRNACVLRGLHPSGVTETIVRNERELENVRRGTAVRIAHGVGEKKRSGIIARAKELRLRILNE